MSDTRLDLQQVVDHLIDEDPNTDAEIEVRGDENGRFAQVWDASDNPDNATLVIWGTDDPDDAAFEPEEAEDWGQPYGLVDRDTGRIGWPVTRFVWEDELAGEDD